MKRDITIETTLGDDVLLFHRMAATEQMSRLFTYDVELYLLTEAVLKPLLYEMDGYVRDINSDPRTTELLRDCNRRTATAERIKHYTRLWTT